MQRAGAAFQPGGVVVFLILVMASAVVANDLKRFLFEPENPIQKKINIRERRQVSTDNAVMYGQNRKLVEILTQTWETREGAWADSSRIVIAWDGDKDTAMDYYYRSGGTWVYDEHLLFTYTSNDSLNDAYSRKWVPDSGKWLDYFQEIFAYDPSQGYMVEDYIKLNYRLFDPDNASSYPAGLTDYEKDRYTYNSDRQVTEITIQEVLTSDFMLSNSKRARYTYDAYGNLSQFNLQLYVSSAWEDSQFVKFTYNTNNQIVKDSMCTYRRTNRSWNPHSMQIYAYSSFDSLESITLKRYRSLLWADTLRMLFEYYDDSRLESKSIFQEWSADSGTWLNISCGNSIYSGNDLTEYVYQEYENNAWVNKQRTLYSYETVVLRRGRDKGTGVSPAVAAAPDGRIRFICTAPSVVSAIVYDAHGNALSTLASGRSVPAGEHTLFWDMKSDWGNAIAPGLYLCKVKINTVTIYTHLLLLK